MKNEALGRGGQGQPFLVLESSDGGGKEFVAKVLSGGVLKESPRWKRLEEEIATAKSFDHPNVIHVVDSGYTAGAGYPFYVMPHYSGGSLQNLDAGSQTPAAVFDLFAGICDGVAYVHSKNIVHRDLKPANIFLEGHRAIVGDFGLCFRLDAESLTETMEVATARWFGAPELRNGHEPRPTPSADVYSLGKLQWNTNAPDFNASSNSS